MLPNYFIFGQIWIKGQCLNCQHKTNNALALRLHATNHHALSHLSVFCLECFQTFETITELLRHVLEKHLVKASMALGEIIFLNTQLRLVYCHISSPG